MSVERDPVDVRSTDDPPLHWGSDRRFLSFTAQRSLKRSLIAEQRKSWEEGQPLEIDELLRRWPVEPSSDPDVARLLAEDFTRRRDQGQVVHLQDYTREFPRHHAQVSATVSLQQAIETVTCRPVDPARLLRLPEVGEELFGFRLKAPLGQGAFARVFLAEQADLAGRPVVLKVSAIEGSEHRTLAQLQHTNIVPIYSVHEDSRAGLRAVCMPYFGGASLSSVLARVREQPTPAESGDAFVSAFESVCNPSPESVVRGSQVAPHPSTLPGSPLDALRSMSYVEVAAWIVAGLAEGLHHAHTRGILHRDVKPSNVLIGSDGQPLLLDFNLAHDQHEADADATLGGTIAYMAPEHLRALLDYREDANVDRRSDLYSLGMVLGEILTDASPFQQSGSYSARPVEILAMAAERAREAPSFRKLRPDLPWGLESIARKCLDPEPARRYQQADQLAEDLRRFLDDRPLRYAPELSRVEQARKFLRRHPRLVAAGPVVLASGVILGGVGWTLAGTRANLERASHRLDDARIRDRVRRHDQGTIEAQCLINTAMDLPDHFRRGIGVCARTLALFEPPSDRPGEEHPDLARLEPDERRRIAEDRRELLLALAGARVRVAPGDRNRLAQALDLLEQADAIPGLPPSRALWEDRARYLDLLGETAKADYARRAAEDTPATTARDHYLLATAFARRATADGYRRAISELDQALRLNPKHYWSTLQRGICHLLLGDDVAAAGDFGAGIGLWPEFPWAYFNRGYVLDRSGKKSRAIDDYSSSLALDPAFVPAYLNRGLARLELSQHQEALADFDQALKLGGDDARAFAGRGIALEGSQRHAEADTAFARALELAGGRPTVEADRIRWAYGFAIYRRLPDRAEAMFREVLARDPAQPESLYGLAMVEADRGQVSPALEHLEKAIIARAGFLEARRHRAVLLARRNEWTEASREINVCLEREPNSGENLYAAACVAALAFQTNHDPRNHQQALDFLDRAVARGQKLEMALADPDLASIHEALRKK